MLKDYPRVTSFSKGFASSFFQIFRSFSGKSLSLRVILATRIYDSCIKSTGCFAVAGNFKNGYVLTVILKLINVEINSWIESL